jgi:hypothetical protein
LLLILCSVAAAFAKPKEKVFNNSAQQVFQATLRTARERHVVTYVDEKNLMLTFETGTSLFSGGFVCNASVEQLPNGRSNLIINVQSKNNGKGGLAYGAGGRMADKFFKQVAEEIAREPKQKVSYKGEVQHIAAPASAQPTTAPRPVRTGTVLVSSAPKGADVLVDGNFVGNAPATLKLSAGKHVVTVREAGYKTWSKDLTVLADSDVSLNADLEKQ